MYFEELPGRWECEACDQAHTFSLFSGAPLIKAAGSLDPLLPGNRWLSSASGGVDSTVHLSGSGSVSEG